LINELIEEELIMYSTQIMILYRAMNMRSNITAEVLLGSFQWVAVGNRRWRVSVCCSGVIKFIVGS